jgi:probable HAF family extracellular repeat protein
MTDLGTVGSDPCSFAQGVNDLRQVVGDSSPSDCVNFDTSRAFLWEHGSIVDLNILVPPNSPLYLIYAYTINNSGEIAVNGIDALGVEQAAVLIPCDENHADVEGCDYNLVDSAAAADLSPAVSTTAGTETATSAQQLTSGQIVASTGTQILRVPNIKRVAINAGAYSLSSVAVTDSQSPAVQNLTITSGTPPRGTVGTPYDVHCNIPLCGGSIVIGFPLAASGGVPSYSWTWVPQPGSSLPPALGINPHFGIHGCGSFANSFRSGICGTPTIAGSYNVTVKVTDSASPRAQVAANYTIRINASASAALNIMRPTAP